MASPSKDVLEAEGTLRILIEQLIDSQELLARAGEEMKNDAVKRRLLAESLKRAEFRGELENILHREGVRDVKESGTAAGKVVRAWAGLKGALGGGDASMLAATEESEHGMIDTYADALRRDLPLPIRHVLAEQAAHVVSTHEYVRAARAEAA